MVLRPYSEKLKRYFETEEECLAAEKAFDEKEEKIKAFKAEKKEAAKYLEELKNDMIASYKEAENKYNNYNEEVKKFVEKYKEPFRTSETCTTISLSPPAVMLSDIFRTFFS